MPSYLLEAVGAEIKDLSLRVLQYRREIWRETGVKCFDFGCLEERMRLVRVLGAGMMVLI